MRRVLIIAPDFLPSDRPPALRIKTFVRHLPEFGWEPTILTVEPPDYEWSVDAENKQLMPEPQPILRTRALPTSLTRLIGIGDIGIRSLGSLWKTAKKLCTKKRFDLVFISIPPAAPALLGRLIYQRFGIPYVIDYIDPWVSTEYRKLPKKLRPKKRALSYVLSRLLEPFALKDVGYLVGVSKRTVDSVILRYPWLRKIPAKEILYGGEPNDFEYLSQHPRVNQVFNSKDGFLHISYVGVYSPSMRDTLQALLEAIRLGLSRSPENFNRLQFHFVGTNYVTNSNGDSPFQVMPLAERLGLEGVVHEIPTRMFYLDTLQVLLDSHALVAIGSDAPHYTASKIFPYILAKKPLLAIFHEESSVVRILEETQAGRIVTFNSKDPPARRVREISNQLEEILSLSPCSQVSTRWEAFEAYTAKAMTRRLAKVFDEAS